MERVDVFGERSSLVADWQGVLLLGQVQRLLRVVLALRLQGSMCGKSVGLQLGKGGGVLRVVVAGAREVHQRQFVSSLGTLDFFSQAIKALRNVD